MAQQCKVDKHKTNIFTNDGHTVVQYCETQIVRFSANEIILDSAGWRTATTKTRMNQTSRQYNLGFKVYQKNYSWFVWYNGETLDFEDKMVLVR